LLLAAGLEGIEQKITPPHELTKNILQMTEQDIADAGIELLPKSLGEALEAYEADPLIKETLGEHAFTSYLKVKRGEWADYSREVHDWEVHRYLSIY
jgi:glutamine synthetase